MIQYSRPLYMSIWVIWMLCATSIQGKCESLVVLRDGSCVYGSVETMDADALRLLISPPTFVSLLPDAKPDVWEIELGRVQAIVLTVPVSQKDEQRLVCRLRQLRESQDCVVYNNGTRQFGFFEKMDWLTLVWKQAEASPGVASKKYSTTSIPTSEVQYIFLTSHENKSSEDSNRNLNSDKRSASDGLYPVWATITGLGRICGSLEADDWFRLQPVVSVEPVLKNMPKRQKAENSGDSTGKPDPNQVAVSFRVNWLEKPLVVPVSEIEAIEPIPSRFAFPFYWLSSVPVVQYKYIPFGILNRPYYTDFDPNGAPLRSNAGTVFRHGFYLYASCRLTFQLPEPANFKSETPRELPDGAVCFSGSVARSADAKQGSVRCRMFYEGKPLGEWTLTADDKPQDFRFILKASPNSRRRLDWVVDFADDNATDDIIILGNPRIEYLTENPARGGS